jgi:hypothetical protein
MSILECVVLILLLSYFCFVFNQKQTKNDFSLYEIAIKIGKKQAARRRAGCIRAPYWQGEAGVGISDETSNGSRSRYTNF